MQSISISLLICVIYVFEYCFLDSSGWGYISIHCRDNDNAPVDWWYIYKPPNEDVPFLESRLNFTYITPKSKGRWEASNKYITTSSMLQYTLAPMFRPTYTDYIAVAIYEKREGSRNNAGSVAYGVLMADEMGGIWIYHTIPDLINMQRNRPLLFEEGNANGHLLMCLSFDWKTMNIIFRNIQATQLNFTYLKVPRRMLNLLPDWNLSKDVGNSKSLKMIELETPDELQVEIVMKPPGSKKSLYKEYARYKNTVLDVYGQTDAKFSQICGEKYSVRSIDSISFKYPETVVYINNNTDRVHFAVSAANLREKGTRVPREYFTCISNLDKGVTKLGGDMVCVKSYKIWLAFDNLKVKEPKC